MTPSAANSRALRLYRLVLHAYPRDFRMEYGAEMQLVFRDAYREARQRGVSGWLRFWSTMTGDLVTSVCVQHLRHWSQRGKEHHALAGKEQLAMALHSTLTIGQHTDIGRVRSSNEDNLLAIIPADTQILDTKGALFVVADGMGGQQRGEVASELAVQIVNDHYYQSREDIPTALHDALVAANMAIYAAGESDRAQGNRGLGTTCVAAVLHEQTLYVANVGDSRAYVLRDDHLRQITEDHSLVAQMVARGEVTPDAARQHEQRFILYRSLGQEEVEIDLVTAAMQPGDTFILCTDGISGVLDDEAMCALVTQFGADESARHLIERANEAGGPDNATAIVVQVMKA